jgi:hypothetical protein
MQAISAGVNTQEVCMYVDGQRGNWAEYVRVLKEGHREYIRGRCPNSSTCMEW